VEIDDYYQEVEHFYQVPKDIIIEEWKKRLYLIAREDKKRQARVGFTGEKLEIKNLLLKSLQNVTIAQKRISNNLNTKKSKMDLANIKTAHRQ